MTRKTPFSPKCKRASENFFKNNAEARKNRSPHLNLGQVRSGVGLLSRRHIQRHGVDALGEEQLAIRPVRVVGVDIILQRALEVDFTAVLRHPELLDPGIPHGVFILAEERVVLILDDIAVFFRLQVLVQHQNIGPLRTHRPGKGSAVCHGQRPALLGGSDVVQASRPRFAHGLLSLGHHKRVCLVRRFPLASGFIQAHQRDQALHTTDRPAPA